MNFVYYVILVALCCEATVFPLVAQTISSPSCWVCSATFAQILYLNPFEMKWPGYDVNAVHVTTAFERIMLAVMATANKM